MHAKSRSATEHSPSSPRIFQPRHRPFATDRRRFLSGALALAVGGALAATGRIAPAYADDEDDPADQPPETVGVPSASGAHAFSLGTGADRPLGEGVTQNKDKAEVGYARYEGDGFVLHLNGGKDLLSNEWISRRIGRFSFRDGAVMVEARGELSDTGCMAIEMRQQAYKDHRYIRSNWLCLDPHDGHVHIQTDGMFNEMQIVAQHQHDGYTPVRPPGEWNTFLFLASGDYLEGWVNGERAIAGQDGRWGSGNISLVAQRVDRAPFQARFRNLQIWDGVLPDPTTVW